MSEYHQSKLPSRREVLTRIIAGAAVSGVLAATATKEASGAENSRAASAPAGVATPFTLVF